MFNETKGETIAASFHSLVYRLHHDNEHRRAFTATNELSVIVLESVEEVGNGGQPISMKLAAEVSLDEISQKPIWFCFLTFG